MLAKRTLLPFLPQLCLVVAIALLAGLNVGPASVSAQADAASECESTDVFCATLTADTIGTGKGYHQSQSLGTLSPNTFDHSNETYPVALLYTAQPAGADNQLNFGATSSENNLTALHGMSLSVGGSVYDIGSPDEKATDTEYRWNDDFGFTGGQSYTVRIGTPNDPPVIDGAATRTFTIDENVGAGASVGTQFTATDADGDTITWSLAGDDAASFSFRLGTLYLSSAHDPDYETKQSYSVTVQADDGIDSDTVALTVNVNDLDEPPGKPDAPTLTEATSDSLSVSWTAPSNTGPDIDDYDVLYREGTTGRLRLLGVGAGVLPVW